MAHGQTDKNINTYLLSLLNRFLAVEVITIPKFIFAAPVPSCGHDMSPVDIAIMLDSTYSITKDNWPVMIQFVKDVTDRVNYGPNDVRKG